MKLRGVGADKKGRQDSDHYSRFQGRKRSAGPGARPGPAAWP